jgi:hypothetical protein
VRRKGLAGVSVRECSLWGWAWRRRRLWRRKGRIGWGGRLRLRRRRGRQLSSVVSWGLIDKDVFGEWFEQEDVDVEN